MLFTISTLTTFAAVLSVASPTFASKVICNRGPNCYAADDNVAQKLTDYINFIDRSRRYHNREFIACQKFEIDTVFERQVFAFMQKKGGARGSSIRSLAHNIPDNGCKVCGSVPFYYPEGYGGDLTYDVVSQRGLS